jgi:hypothetical protein
MHAPLLSPIRAAFPAQHIFLDLILLTILVEEYRSLSYLLSSFLHFPCYLVPLRPKCSLQHPILKHPQTMFLPECERPSLTPVQTTGKTIVLLIFLFLGRKLEEKRLSPNESRHSLTSLYS